MAESTLKEILKRRSDDTIRRIQQRRSWAQRDREGIPWGRVLLWVLFGLVLLVSAYVFTRARQASALLDAALSDQPVQVYARPLVLKPGQAWTAETLVRELRRLGYAEEVEGPGTYQLQGPDLRFTTRAFTWAEGVQPSQQVVATLADGRLVGLVATAEARSLDELRLDPMLLGSLLSRQALAETVVLHAASLSSVAPSVLLAISDPGSTLRSGIDYGALFDGLLGGGQRSMPQQLLRSLNRDARGFLRPLDEVVMAAALEWREPPERVFQAWLNHVHLGQDGGRAVRGVGGAAYHWFGKPAAELGWSELALLGVLARQPTVIDPRKAPAEARRARDEALEAAVARGELPEQRVRQAQAAELGVPEVAPAGTSYNPAYMSLVRQHLLQEYGEGELARSGLQTLTAFDPVAQERGEVALSSALAAVERAQGLPVGTLDGAAVLVDVPRGEVVAMIAGRDAQTGSRNRALDRALPVGSLVHPAIWYTAMMDGKRRFDWARLMEDAPVSIDLPDGTQWKPHSADGQYRGRVSAWTAAIEAHAMPALRAGLELGVQEVLVAMQRFGFSRVVTPSPSLLLGEVNMTPYEVAQQYHTLARGGERIRLTALRSVVYGDGSQVPRASERRAERALDARGAYLVGRALQEAARRGAARELGGRHGLSGVAAQVGISQERRGGWVAGFGSDYVLVVWVGRVDDAPNAFGGVGGALPVWAAIADALDLQPFVDAAPEGVITVHMDANSGAPTGAACPGAVAVPFLIERAPAPTSACASAQRARAAQVLRDAAH